MKILDTITEETIAKCVTLLEQLSLPTETEKTVSELVKSPDNKRVHVI